MLIYIHILKCYSKLTYLMTQVHFLHFFFQIWTYCSSCRPLETFTLKRCSWCSCWNIFSIQTLANQRKFTDFIFYMHIYSISVLAEAKLLLWLDKLIHQISFIIAMPHFSLFNHAKYIANLLYCVQGVGFDVLTYVSSLIYSSQFTGDGDKYADTVALAIDVANKRVSVQCWCVVL